MKIGILSYWDTQYNYGQVLQCFALQQFVKSIGHTPQHIKYVKSKRALFDQIIDLIKIVISGNMISFIKLYRNTKSQAFMEDVMSDEANNSNRKFDEFRKKFISFTESEYTLNTLKRNPPAFDAYICGSDQIWSSPTIPYMLQFGNRHIKRLAYAASLGGIVFDNKYQVRLIRKYLKRFNYISIRELDGVDELNRLGITNAKLVLDPTFLLSSELYRNIAVNPQRSNYLFLYLLGNKIDLNVNLIYEWASKNNLEVIYVASQGRIDNYPKITPTVNEWIGLIDNAKYIITNSFHGMALSIMLEKQFMVVPLSEEYERMNGRIYSILKRFNLMNRCYKGNFKNIHSEIDYKSVRKQIQAEQFEIRTEIKAIIES